MSFSEDAATRACEAAPSPTTAVPLPGVGDDTGPVSYGRHGGVVGLTPGSYACAAFDEATTTCLVRAIFEEEIVAARDGLAPESAPQWMRTALGSAMASASVTPTSPSDIYGVPGLLESHLDPEQAVFVRCLAGTPLGLPLAQWHDPWVYHRGHVEQCRAEARHADRPGSLPLPARYLQEAAVIQSGAQRLLEAGEVYASHAGRAAGSVTELLEATVLRAPPLRTPSMTSRGYVLGRSRQVTVDLAAPAADLCRALNLLQGRAWHVLPAALPDGSRAGCYATAQGFRFEAG